MSRQADSARAVGTLQDPELWVRIADVCIRILERDGPAGLTGARVAAEMGVPRDVVDAETTRYSLRELATMRGWELFADILAGASAAADSPDSAVFAVASTYREFANLRPELHQIMSETAPRTDNAQFLAIGQRTLRVFDEPFAAMGIATEQRLHLARVIRCAVFGFVAMEKHGQFALASNSEQTFRIMVEVLLRGIEARLRSR